METRTDQIWKLMRHGTPIDFVSSVGYNGRSGDMVGVVTGTPMGEGTGSTIKALVQLTAVKGVKPSDFFDSQGVPHITAGGRTYRIADNVECFRSINQNLADSANWISGTKSERLSAIKTYGDSFTIYVDPVGQQVRVIAAN